MGWMNAVRSAAVLLALAGIAGSAMADDFVNPKANIAPKAAPQRRNGGEGMPPLPLPATPLRRSEKKTRAIATRSRGEHHLPRIGNCKRPV